MPQLTQEQLEFFNTNGYLIIEDVLNDLDLDNIRKEYEAILDREVPKLVDSGQLSQDYKALPFEERYTKILQELDDMYALYQYLDISLPLLHKMEADASLNAGPAVFKHLLSNPKILDIAESIVGPELYSNPVQHTRIKPPQIALKNKELDSNVARTGWHQDEAVLSDEAVDINILTVWVAITDATEENGCMVCVPGSHKQDVSMHCPGNTFSSAEIFIPDELIDQKTVTPMPVKKGGVVLLHQLTEHASLENKSEQIRWSFDLRYNVIGQNSGREIFPGFVVRSQKHPEEILTDAQIWAEEWFNTRNQLAAQGDIAFNERWKKFNRHSLCA